MKKRKGITLVGTIVTILIILFILAVLMPLHGRNPKIAKKVVCGTRLKNLGFAITDYAIDNDDRFPQLPGTGPWSKDLGFAYDMQTPDFSLHGAQGNVGRSIIASWYLLVRTTDIEFKNFVCPASNQDEYNGRNPQKRDIKNLWDFGTEPLKHVSYVMHNPYGQFPADYRRSAAFAVAADMSQYFENGNIQNPKQSLMQKYHQFPFDNQLYNSSRHENEGQNVLYADGHGSWETRPDVGVKYDNIYTYWRIKAENTPTEQDKRVGQPPTDRSPVNDAWSKDDSFLAI
jgi:prepilin-type processing-associated H-X9-DG protein